MNIVNLSTSHPDHQPDKETIKARYTVQERILKLQATIDAFRMSEVFKALMESEPEHWKELEAITLVLTSTLSALHSTEIMVAASNPMKLEPAVVERMRATLTSNIYYHNTVDRLVDWVEVEYKELGEVYWKRVNAEFKYDQDECHEIFLEIVDYHEGGLDVEIISELIPGGYEDGHPTPTPGNVQHLLELLKIVRPDYFPSVS